MVIKSVFVVTPCRSGRCAGSSSRQSDDDDDTYSHLVIPPPPSSQVSDNDLQTFLDKIMACNGVVADVVSLNGLSLTSKYLARQMSDPAHSRFQQLAETQSARTVVNPAAVSDSASLPHDIDNAEILAHRRYASTMNNVESASSNNNSCFVQTTSSPPAQQASNNDGRLTAGVVDGTEAMFRDNNWYSSQSQVSSAVQLAVSHYACALSSPVTHRSQVHRLPSGGATGAMVRSPMLSHRGGTLTRSIGRRRPPPPPPPPRTSSVQNSPALSCRSEQLTRRGIPRLAGAAADRLTPLPTPPPPSRSALIRPGALRSSFTASKEPDTTVTVSPPSPDWNFRRSHSLTESAPVGRSTPTGTRPSLLATIGSRLRSYWSPSSKPRRERPATASGERQPLSADYRRPQLPVPSRYDVGGLLIDDDDNDDDDAYMSLNVEFTSRQLRMSPTMSSFSSFTGE